MSERGGEGFLTHAAEEKLRAALAAETRRAEEAERNADSLRLALQGCEHTRRRDNEYLIGQRDIAREALEQIAATGGTMYEGHEDNTLQRIAHNALAQLPQEGSSEKP